MLTDVVPTAVTLVVVVLVELVVAALLEVSVDGVVLDGALSEDVSLDVVAVAAVKAVVESRDDAK